MAIAAGLLALGAIVVVISLASIGRLHNLVSDEAARMRAARGATYALTQASIDAETGQRGYLLTRDRGFLEPYERGRTVAAEQLARLQTLAASDAELAARVGRVEGLAERAFASLAEAIEAPLSAPTLRANLTASKAEMDELRNELALLVQMVERRVEQVRSEERENTRWLYRIGGLLAVLTLLAVALTMWALRSERRNWRAAFDALQAANAAAEEARQRAHASDLAKTRFLAVASHDMRQPLHALALYLSALERRVEGAEARDIIRKMDRATQSMVGMFSTLLDLARIQAGVVQPEIEAVRVQDVLDRIVAENPGGQVEAADTSLTANTDPLLLERILRNLVTNALKHGGGSARISARNIGDAVEISVADNGPGIRPEDQERIFDEFVRLEGRAEGLGLGLAIVKRIADLLDAPLRVESEPGQGARFSLRVPSARFEDARASPAPHAVAFAGAPVLVVDDDADAREAVGGMLTDRGADARLAGNEAEAEALLGDGFLPRLIVMDLSIDGELVGVGAAQRLRERITPSPAVVIITGETAPETMAQLRDCGFPWLIKPVSAEDLGKAAADLLENSTLSST